MYFFTADNSGESSWNCYNPKTTDWKTMAHELIPWLWWKGKKSYGVHGVTYIWVGQGELG